MKKNKSTNNKNFSFKNLFLVTLLSLSIFVISFMIFFIIYIVATAPKFNPELLYSSESSILYDINNKEFAKIGSETRELVTYDDLPQVLIDAIVATEDSRFFQHGGFDLPRFLKATFLQVLGNSGAGGASTLTMQVSKNTFTSTEASGLEGLIRKFTDIYMSVFQIEKNYTKEEIIEFYVNAPWLANQSYGVEQTCQTYFGKSVNDLNLAEASFIAGIFQSPYSYNPYIHPELAEKRRNKVLELMLRHGYITKEEKEDAQSISVTSMILSKGNEGVNPYQGFIDTVVEEILDKTGHNPYKEAMIIQTTMDPATQDVINDLMNGKLYTYVNNTVQNAVAITSTKDGSIVAIGKGRNKNEERGFNLATMMIKHPGSTAKPIFDYGPNIEFNNGSTYSPFFDEPMTYSNGTKLKNADGQYLGLMTSKQALVKSRNIPAVQAFQSNDPQKIASFVHSLGITYGDYLYESAAIGGFDGVSPLQMSAAYAAFGRGGYYIEPYSWTKITLKKSNEVIEQKAKPLKVMSEETAYMINFMLAYGGATGVGGNINVSGTDVAAKGGTSTYDKVALDKYHIPASASADNWLNVYTPDYSISTWYGYESLKEGQYVLATAGSTARKKIMTAIANKILKKNSRFKVPSGVVKMEVELETFPAMMPSAYTPESLISTEVFRRGTEPSEVSTRFSTLNAPTNGNSSTSGNVITINWDKIKTPNAIDTNYLTSYYNKNFKSKYNDFSDKYYQKRLSYNKSSIGDIGYQVYLLTDTNLVNLGWTQNNYFNYTANNPNQNYKFVVKSAYSIFKSNMSAGLEINVSAPTQPQENPISPLIPE